MANKFIPLVFFASFLLVQTVFLHAQDRRYQYPAALSNSFVGVSIGYINYPFTQKQLEPGYHAASVHIPHTAVRITLFGHEFNKYLSAQITYMRPVGWVEYRNVNNDNTNHSVWMNVAGVTVKGQTPSWKKFSLYGEAGFALITRHGFAINDQPVITNANYGTVLAGGGVQYELNRKWKLLFSSVYSPENNNSKQPHTIFYSAAFTYTMRPLSKEKLEADAKEGNHFSKNVLQIGYTTNGIGYGVNKAVSKGPVPIFWGGDVKVRRGVSLNYQHNIFHSKKVFSWDWGVNASYWQSRNNRENFFTISLFPLLRFTAFRSSTADIYFVYSVAGPTYISRDTTDGLPTGTHFTFQDYMGMGAFLSSHKNLNVEIRIMHYSNGNLFPQNDGYMIPLTFNLGYSF
jgi:hypothetical protein